MDATASLRAGEEEGGGALLGLVVLFLPSGSYPASVTYIAEIPKAVRKSRRGTRCCTTRGRVGSQDAILEGWETPGLRRQPSEGHDGGRSQVAAGTCPGMTAAQSAPCCSHSTPRLHSTAQRLSPLRIPASTTGCWMLHGWRRPPSVWCADATSSTRFEARLGPLRANTSSTAAASAAKWRMAEHIRWSGVDARPPVWQTAAVLHARLPHSARCPPPAARQSVLHAPPTPRTTSHRPDERGSRAPPSANWGPAFIPPSSTHPPTQLIFCFVLEQQQMDGWTDGRTDGTQRHGMGVPSRAPRHHRDIPSPWQPTHPAISMCTPPAAGGRCFFAEGGGGRSLRTCVLPPKESMTMGRLSPFRREDVPRISVGPCFRSRFCPIAGRKEKIILFYFVFTEIHVLVRAQRPVPMEASLTEILPPPSPPPPPPSSCHHPRSTPGDRWTAQQR